MPFAHQLTDSLPKDRLEVRRTFGHLLSLIKAVALLYQFQRQRNHQNQIIATVQDYDIVRTHLPGPLARGLGCALTPGASDLLEMARNRSTFTVSQIVGKSHCSDNTIRGRINELLNTGQITRLQESSGRKPAVYCPADDPPSMGDLALPELVVENDHNEESVPELLESVEDKT